MPLRYLHLSIRIFNLSAFGNPGHIAFRFQLLDQPWKGTSKLMEKEEFRGEEKQKKRSLFTSFQSFHSSSRNRYAMPLTPIRSIPFKGSLFPFPLRSSSLHGSQRSHQRLLLPQREDLLVVPRLALLAQLQVEVQNHRREEEAHFVPC